MNTMDSHPKQSLCRMGRKSDGPNTDPLPRVKCNSAMYINKAISAKLYVERSKHDYMIIRQHNMLKVRDVNHYHTVEGEVVEVLTEELAIHPHGFVCTYWLEK